MTWRVANEGMPRAAAVALAFLVVLSIAGCTTYQPVTRAVAPADGTRHTVRPGDTVGELAKRYGVSIGAIASANRLRNPNRIYVGQVLTIPGGDAAGGTAYASAPAERSTLRVAAAGPRRARDVIPVAASTRAPPSAVPVETRPTRLETAALPAEAAPAGAPADPPARPPATAKPVAPVAPAAMPTPERRAVQEAAQTEPPPLSGDGFLWPVAAGDLLDDFGIKPNGQRNDGINIEAPRGAPVRAAENGVVVYAGDGIEGFGKMVLLKHQDGFTTAYAHADQLDVAVGDVVRRGQTLARVGATGSVASPQLHFELRSGRSPLDPRKHLVGQPSLLAGTGARSS